MKVRAIAVLTVLLGASRVIDACPQPYIDELNQGRAPKQGPVVEDCPTKYEKDFAAALVVFTKTQPPEAVQAAVTQVRDAHRAAGRNNVYKTITAEVQQLLAGYTPKETGDPFEALNNLHELAVKPQVIPERKPEKPKPAHPPPAPVVQKPETKQTISPRMLALAIASAAALAGLIAFVWRRMRKPKIKFDDTELGRRLTKLSAALDASVQFLGEKVQKRTDELGAKIEALPSPEILRAEMNALRAEFVRLNQTLEEIATRSAPQAGSDRATHERQILAELWKQFSANKELSASYNAAVDDSSWELLIKQLAQIVPDDLRPTFDAVVAPCREHRTLVRKIGLVPRIINGEIKPLESEAEEVLRSRECANILTSAQTPGETSNRLNFRFKNWITDTFLPFADLYLQRYQQAQLENRDAEMRNGVSLVREVLRIAAVEPIEVTPGETAFDSTRHIGRSISNDPRFSDGVITGVVRNGFIERGQQVLRQPEVIVNRMR